MKLHRIRVRGHRLLKDSGWFTVERGKTVFSGDPAAGTVLLRALLSINPPSDESVFHALHDYLKFTKDSLGRTRKVIPAKKTYVLAVFSAEDALPKELADLDPVFFETDKIEVGRRLDKSRWITFVEIADSHRWLEIAPDVVRLRARLEKTAIPVELLAQYDALTDLADTARIIDETARELEDWLAGLAKYLEGPDLALLEKIRTAVSRPERFKEARKTVARQMPIFVYFQDSFVPRAGFNLNELAVRIKAQTLDMEQDFGALCFLKLLGRQPLELAAMATAGGFIAETLATECRAELAAVAAGLADLIAPLWGEEIGLAFKADGDYLHLLSLDKQAAELALVRRRAEFIWLAGFGLVFLACAGAEPTNAVLLLDQPGREFSRRDRQGLDRLISALAAKNQTLINADPRYEIDAEQRRQIRLLQPMAAADRPLPQVHGRGRADQAI